MKNQRRLMSLAAIGCLVAGLFPLQGAFSQSWQNEFRDTLRGGLRRLQAPPSIQPALCLTPFLDQDTNSTSSLVSINGKLTLRITIHSAPNPYGGDCQSNDFVGAVINVPNHTPCGTISFNENPLRYTGNANTPLYVYVSGKDSTGKVFGGGFATVSGNKVTFNLLNLNNNGTTSGENATPGSNIKTLYIVANNGTGHFNDGSCDETIDISNITLNGSPITKAITKTLETNCPTNFRPPFPI